MNRLIALRVGSFNCFHNLYILNNTVIDIEKQGFAFDGIEFGNDHLYLNLIYYLFR